MEMPAWLLAATSICELEAVRSEIGDDFPILIPGIGAQGGDLEQAAIAGSNSHGQLAIINVARGIIYAGREIDFRDKVRDCAEKYRMRISAAIGKKQDQI